MSVTNEYSDFDWKRGKITTIEGYLALREEFHDYCERKRRAAEAGQLPASDEPPAKEAKVEDAEPSGAAETTGSTQPDPEKYEVTGEGKKRLLSLVYFFASMLRSLQVNGSLSSFENGFLKIARDDEKYQESFDSWLEASDKDGHTDVEIRKFAESLFVRKNTV